MTRSGWAVARAAAALYVLGWALGYVELVMLAVAGALALVSALPWVALRPAVAVSRTISPSRVARGEESWGRLTISAARRLVWGGLVAEEPVGPTAVRVAVPRLRRRKAEVVEYRLTTDRRGVFDVGPLRVSRSDPLGLLERFQDHGRAEVLHVHPVVHAVRAFPLGEAPHLDGPMADSVPRGSVTFHTLREYTRGDDLRHIHWKSTAKVGNLMIKQHVDTSEPGLVLVLHTAAAVHTPEGFEEAVEIAASIAVASIRQRHPVRFATTSGVAAWTEGSADAQRFLDRMAGVERSADAALSDLVGHVRGQRGASVLVVVTGMATVADMAAIGSLRRRFGRVLIVAVGPERSSVSVPPGCILLDVADAADFVDEWKALVRR